jgi:2-amino-4-hydroxy-6-hydroxymethyldihydropteridine diphosphokinase
VIHTAYVGLGANLGDPVAQVRGALRGLESLGCIRASSLYRTEPVGDATQPWYVNAVAQIRTELGVHPLFRELRRLEALGGRPVERPSGEARTLDLDLLLYDDLILEAPEIVVPHPRLHERRFVLEPLAEIAPGARHPRSNLSAVEMLRVLRDPARTQKLQATDPQPSNTDSGTLRETRSPRRATP